MIKKQSIIQQFILFIFFFNCNHILGQEKIFNAVYSVEATCVKDQGNSGTCWAFGTTSFLESEVIKKGKPPIDLSEWFVVRYIYPEKIRNYLRTQGNTYFTAGGQFQDVLWVLKNKGVVPESVYSGGPNVGASGINSEKLDTCLDRYVRAIRKAPEDIIEKDWEKEIDSTLNKMIGIPPQSFLFNNKKYTPKTFAQYLNLNENDYIQLTSFSHHPFYQNFCLESRYNWSYSLYYNIPLDEWIQSIDHALSEGYTVALNTDVSGSEFESGFLKGYIINSRENTVTQEIRQKAFETGHTTVDHIMHITGMARDEKNEKFYIVKNSWGSFYKEGFLYISENYIREMGVSILINKNALISKLKKKF